MLLAFFCFSWSWLIEQVHGKHWAIYLTTLFLNFLISNAVLFIRSFEIFSSTQNTGANSQCRYHIANPLDVSLWRPPASNSLGMFIKMHIPPGPTQTF